ncbi:MAG: CocE/NonD family hydrolase, partial [Longimicrobiales bacterium]
GATKNYVGAVRASSDPSRHKLIIGPWLHSVNRDRVIGERDFGPESIIELDALRDAWLDHVMLGAPAPDQPNVRYFVQGSNVWKSATAWPLPDTRFTDYHLASGGHANTLLGDGELRRGAPADGPPDGFTYDPADPVPTMSSRTAGSRSGIPAGSVDNRAVETRQDVLVYTTEPLREGVEVTGPVTATIHFETDVPDTDITVKLLDVSPDGKALNLTHGVARAKYRESYAEPKPLETGVIYELEVELFPTSNYFEAGHRIRIEVSSSNFPLFARNLNTMDSDTGVEMRQAHTRIHHTPEHPSRITLPIVPNGVATDDGERGRR